MARHRFCDGIERRDFLKVGVVSAAGLHLSRYLALAEAGALGKATAHSVVFVDLRGGPSHLDTFDPKPEAPAEIRGEFKPIATKVPGLLVSEHLPKFAQCADKVTILRGVSHNLAAHEFGQKYLATGNRPLPSIEFPSIGAVVCKELPCPKDLPPYVAIPNTAQSPGYLGIAYAPFHTTSVPRPGQPYSVRGITIGRGLTVTSLERRERLLGDLDIAFRGYEKCSDLVRGLDRFSQQAHDIISSKRARAAFDVTQESREIVELFGADAFNQSCLLAARLVEAGVRFTTVSFTGWDTHQNNFERLKTNLLPALDRGLAGLLTALEKKGQLASTLVVVTGEFGRTPKVNPNAGRDHWPRAMTVVMAGGGVRQGQVLGASDPKGMGPLAKGFSPDDVAASIYHALGIDPKKEYDTSTGRPVMIVRQGQPIAGLFA